MRLAASREGGGGDPQRGVARRHSTSTSLTGMAILANVNREGSSNNNKGKLVDYSRTRATHSRDANRTSCHGPTMSRNVYKPQQQRRQSTGGGVSALDWDTLSSSLAPSRNEEDEEEPCEDPLLDDSSRQQWIEETVKVHVDDRLDSSAEDQQAVADGRIPLPSELVHRNCSTRLRVRRPSLSKNQTMQEYGAMSCSDHYCSSATSQQRRRGSNDASDPDADDFQPAELSRSKSLNSSAEENPLLKHRRRSLTMANCV